MMLYGLSDSSIAKITAILQTVPTISSAVIYGSRAMGNFREGSDIDLTLKGLLTHDELSKLKGKFDDSDLPYIVDLSVYENIQNPALVEHIDRVGKVFYEINSNKLL